MNGVERIYNPDVTSPVTVKDARLFADTFDGKRPPMGHPLSFDALGVEVGWAPWGKLMDDVEQAKKIRTPSVHLWNRLVIPAFPLRVVDGSMADPEHRLLVRKLLTVELGSIMKRSAAVDITMMLFLSPGGGWTQWPVETTDLSIPISDLQTMAHRLSQGHEKSVSQSTRLSMKHALLYMFTGDIMPSTR